jgi:hypothetical protein
MSDETQNETPDEERTPDPMETAFIAGRSRRNAQRALDAADAVEVDQVLVRAVRDGYYAPFVVVEKYAELLEAETEEAAAAAEAEASTDESTGEGGESTKEVPADNPEWTHGRLDDYAKAHKIELASGLNKTDKVAAILAALNTEE